ncbi:hypothetical protein TNCV_2486101 [Trichonephila clavipes]|uniref:Uncharacterized protein n=1 Tax=Trichonephila clavipes TaxID=2585209 RepID=A0A8X6VZN5_TRICX|nr:hypothetical protein TNCV_2486101 [Trichonephila clavipes]
MKNALIHYKENPREEVFHFHGQTASLKNTNTHNLTIRTKNLCKSKVERRKGASLISRGRAPSAACRDEGITPTRACS